MVRKFPVQFHAAGNRRRGVRTGTVPGLRRRGATRRPGARAGPRSRARVGGYLASVLLALPPRGLFVSQVNLHRIAICMHICVPGGRSPRYSSLYAEPVQPLSLCAPEAAGAERTKRMNDRAQSSPSVRFRARAERVFSRRPTRKNIGVALALALVIALTTLVSHALFKDASAHVDSNGAVVRISALKSGSGALLWLCNSMTAAVHGASGSIRD